MRLDNVRVPRDWMMMKHQKVTPEGYYIKNKRANDKIQYSTMLSIRAGLVIGAGYKLAQGVTIATRYGAVRQQGFVDAAANNRLARENAILDYQTHQVGAALFTSCLIDC